MASYIPVKLTEIQSELDKLEEMNKQNNQLRASLFNLIVYVHKGDKLPYFLDLVDQIVNQFPCRILFIEENLEETTPYLNASIAAKIVDNGDNPNVVCDKIYLETSKNNTEQILHLILRYTLPDLPIYLLWGQDPTLNHPLFFTLKNVATRLIFHSECSTNLQELSRKLLSNILKHDWEVADLNWINLEEWREVLKAIFNSKEALEDLEHVEKVILKFCGSESEYFCHNHFQVHYMHAWLAAQLDWQFASYKDDKLKKQVFYKKKSQNISVEIFEEKCGLSALPGVVMHLEMITTHKKRFTFYTASKEDMIHIEILDEEKTNVAYNTSLMKSKWEVYLAKEICYKETSLHYANTLRVLATIDGLV